jgi:hypothetical protein
MRIDIYPQLNLRGLTPQQALLKTAEHVNQLTDIVVQLNNTVVDLLHRQAELEQQNQILQSQLRR